MGNEFRNIRDFDTLDRKIRKLKATAKALEQQWDENFDYLQDNYKTLVKNSIFKTPSASESMGGSIVQSFINNDRLRNSINRIIEHFAVKAAGWIDSFADRIIEKKRD